MKHVFLFPGQNSRYPEMLERLKTVTTLAVRVMADASEVLGRDIAAHYRADNPRVFERNRDVQVGVFLANFIFARSLETEGIHPSASAGLSLGEYNHLVEIGALDFASALRLLEARGAAYEDAPRGCMVAVFPCQREEIDQALEAGRRHGAVDVSIHLGKTQFVIGGEPDAVQASVAWLEQETFAQSRVVDSALPMHARVFQPAADAFRVALEETPWRDAREPYLPNVDGEFVHHPRADVFADRLYRHVFSTVQWHRSIEFLTRHHPDATFIEVGPGAVLHNLLSRQYRSIRSRCLDVEPAAVPNQRRAAITTT